MPDPLVTLATFATLEEAHLARIRLEEEGVRAFVPDENVLSLGYGTPALFGGVKLQVLRSTVSEAAEILSRRAGDSGMPAVAVEEPTGQPPRREPSVCPECGSSATQAASGRGIVGLILSWLLVTPVLRHRQRWVCRVCGARWRD